MFLAGSWGADFHPDLQRLTDELILLPHKGTGVLEADLPATRWSGARAAKSSSACRSS